MMEIKRKLLLLFIILSNINIYCQDYKIIKSYSNDRTFYIGVTNIVSVIQKGKSKNKIIVTAKYGTVSRKEVYNNKCESIWPFVYFASREGCSTDTLSFFTINKKGDTIYSKNIEYKIIEPYPSKYYIYNIEYQSSKQVVEVNDSVLFLGYGFYSSLHYEFKSCDILLLRNGEIVNSYSSDTTKKYIDRKVIDDIKRDYKSGDKLLIYNHWVRFMGLVFLVKPLEFYIKF